ncbi:MAG: hypothetical protein DRP30_04325 [Thermotoga sp.]|nr:MAG: hypothetical protein DRP30_04325 [Thermotoga sp.]
MHGAKRWYFPDGFLPKGKSGERVSHESLCVMNLNKIPAKVRMTILFDDMEPITYELEIPSMRDLHIRLDKLEPSLPREKPYGIFVESSVEIVAQLSRLDVSEDHYTLMTTVGYSEG